MLILYFFADCTLGLELVIKGTPIKPAIPQDALLMNSFLSISKLFKVYSKYSLNILPAVFLISHI
jgi:hypothetical protein